MKNPWLRLPIKPPYVLNDDLPYIQAHNQRVEDDFAYQTSMFPEPFFGNQEAPVVILNLNPGFSGKADLKVHRSNLKFKKLLTSNLKQKQIAYPFFFLDPALKDVPGYQWWHSRLRALIEQFGLKRVSERLLCLEFFPYHSKRFKRGPSIPSQGYNFFLLEEAMKRKATIISFRSYKLWCDAVPELCDYKYLYRLNSSQSVYLTERNCPEGFRRVVRILGERES